MTCCTIYHEAIIISSNVECNGIINNNARVGDIRLRKRAKEGEHVLDGSVGGATVGLLLTST